jgi:serine/threonine-protein kinase
VPVPKVEGLPIGRAQAKLAPGHFVIKLSHRYSQKVAKDDVIRQSPAATGRIEYGSVVHLVVSDGPEPVNVPSVQGRTVAEATAVLKADGFQVQRLERFSDSVPAGDVIRQNPSSGTALKGSTVVIVASKGPRSFPLPDVEGMSRDVAERELGSLGLDVHVVVIPSSSGKTVVGQDPAPGAAMHRGDSVTIYAA